MNWRGVGVGVAALVAAVPLATVFAGGTQFVRSKTGDVKADAAGAADTVATANFGEAVDAGQVKGQWTQVTYNGTQGWIFSPSLSADKPVDDPSLKAEDGSPLKGDDVDAGSAVRGVGETATKYASKNAIKPEHRRFIDYHQSFVVSDRKITELPPNKDLVTKKDVEAFMAEGKLGPYAK